MKCQQCEKPATFHITELTGGKPMELHLCEEHARKYLTAPSSETAAVGSMAAMLAHQMAVGQTAEELAQLDQQSCPVCGITFTSSAAKAAWAARTITFASKRSSNR
jgi:protein arginine kinase activator